VELVEQILEVVAEVQDTQVELEKVELADQV
jgi:hypothetical protein